MENTANPLVIFLMFIARCLVPLALMLGVSYLLKRFGLIQEPPSPPPDNQDLPSNDAEGDVLHGKA